MRVVVVALLSFVVSACHSGEVDISAKDRSCETAADCFLVSTTCESGCQGCTGFALNVSEEEGWSAYVDAQCVGYIEQGVQCDCYATRAECDEGQCIAVEVTE